MKKPYEEPILEIIRLNACVICTSGGTGSADEIHNISRDPNEIDTDFTP